MTSTDQKILVFGLVGTFAFVLYGAWSLISMVWSDSLVRTLEVLVVLPFLAGWILAPLFWAARPRSIPDEDEGDGDPTVSMAVAVLLVGIGAGAYLYEFLIVPVVFGGEPGLRSLVMVVSVPLAQWLVIVGGAAAQVARRRRLGKVE